MSSLSQEHWIIIRYFRPAGNSGGLQSTPLPLAGSAMESDQGSGRYHVGAGNPQRREMTTLASALVPLPSCPHGGKAFLNLQPVWPCSYWCPPGPRTFSPGLPLAPPASLPGLCLHRAGLHSAPAPRAWESCQPLLPDNPGSSGRDTRTRKIILLSLTLMPTREYISFLHFLILSPLLDNFVIFSIQAPPPATGIHILNFVILVLRHLLLHQELTF